MNEVPPSYARGSMRKFSWDSAWWVFNFVANYANIKYSYMRDDIQKVQRELEGSLLDLQPAVEKTAVDIYAKNPMLVTAYLNNYTIGSAERIVDRWRELGEFLITKYNDGYVQDENGRPQEEGYPDSWLREVLRARPEQFRLERWGTDTLKTDLPY
jgi:dipeptidase